MLVVKKSIPVKMEVVPAGTEIVTLEGKEKAFEECYLCQGTNNDPYFIGKDKVEEMYDEIINGLFVKKTITMKATEMKEAFEVASPWAANEMLKGKSGDFLMESLTDTTDKYPIDRERFFATYEEHKEKDKEVNDIEL